MNGRIRPRDPVHDSNAYWSSPTISSFSVTPACLPSGIITIHAPPDCLSVDSPTAYRKLTCKLYNVMEIHRLAGEVIIDHCWSTPSMQLLDKMEFKTRKSFLLLTILTRHSIGSYYQSSNIHGEARLNSGVVTCVHIYRYDNQDTSSECITSEEITFKHADSTFILFRTIPLSYVASCIAVEKNLIVIATSLGVLVYNVIDLMIGDRGGSPKKPSILWLNPPIQKLMYTCVIHCILMSGSFLVAASGNRVGIWRTNSTEICFSHAAVWESQINECQGQITSIDMIREEGFWHFLAVSCWDGSAYIFRFNTACKNLDEDWERVLSSNGESAVWESPTESGDQVLFPTFVSLLSIKKSYLTRTFMVVSTPGSSIIRCFDIDLRRQRSSFGHDNKTRDKECISVQGLMHITEKKRKLNYKSTCAYLLWIDSNDIIHEQRWLCYEITVPMAPKEIHCKLDRIMLPLTCHELNNTSKAWLMFDHVKGCWNLDCSWTELIDVETRTESTLSLKFLDATVILDLIFTSVKCKNTITNQKLFKNALSQVIMNEKYLCIFLPNDSIFYIYGYHEKGWMALDTETVNHYQFCKPKATFVMSHRLILISPKEKFKEKTILNLKIWNLSDNGANLCSIDLPHEGDMDIISEIMFEKTNNNKEMIWKISFEVEIRELKGTVEWEFADINRNKTQVIGPHIYFRESKKLRELE